MEKISFSLILALACIASASYCMSPGQRKFMATKSLKEQCAVLQIQTIYAQCHGDKRAINACVLGERYKNLDLSVMLAKWLYLLHGKKGNSLVPKLKCGFSVEELRIFNKFRIRIQLSGANHWTLDLSSLRINDLTGLRNIPGIACVTHLLLCCNRIESLQPNTFKGLHFKFIDLGRNFLAELDPAAFNGLDNLKCLGLRANPIAGESFDTIAQNLCKMFPDLEILRVFD